MDMAKNRSWKLAMTEQIKTLGRPDDLSEVPYESLVDQNKKDIYHGNLVDSGKLGLRVITAKSGNLGLNKIKGMASKEQNPTSCLNNPQLYQASTFLSYLGPQNRDRV